MYFLCPSSKKYHRQSCNPYLLCISLFRNMLLMLFLKLVTTVTASIGNTTAWQQNNIFKIMTIFCHFFHVCFTVLLGVLSAIPQRLQCCTSLCCDAICGETVTLISVVLALVILSLCDVERWKFSLVTEKCLTFLTEN